MSDETFTVKAGFLTKKGRILQGWKRRFFTLDNNGILTYYLSPDHLTTGPQGTINIHDTVSMKIETISTDPKLAGSPSLLLETPNRTYELISDSIEDLHNWLSAIYMVFEGRINSPSDLSQLQQTQQSVDWNKDSIVDFEVEHVLTPDKYQILLSIVEKSWESIHNRVIIIKTFLRWVNYVLSLEGEPGIQSLETLSSGVGLVRVVEILAGKKIGGSSSMTAVDKVNNINLVLNFLRENKLYVSSSVSAIVNENVKSIVSLLWGIFVHFQLEKVKCEGLQGIEGLIRWTQLCTVAYNLVISDFSMSFHDGMVLCGILHHYKNIGEIDPNSLSPFHKAENVECAFVGLEKWFGVPRLLDSNDFLPQPEEVSIVMYITLCYEKLVNSVN